MIQQQKLHHLHKLLLVLHRTLPIQNQSGDWKEKDPVVISLEQPSV
jgi:hypothetical protein